MAESHRPRIVLETRPVARSIEELLQGATAREPLHAGDSKSGAALERVIIGGERYVLKRIDLTGDWLMRAAGDSTGKELVVWESGLLHSLPPSIDHSVVGAARYDGPDGPLIAVLIARHRALARTRGRRQATPGAAPALP